MIGNRWTIGTRLTIWYLAVLVPATLLVTGGSWWLTRRSLVQAADAHLRTRIASAHRLIVGMEHELSLDEIRDEFHEYAELTLGDGLIEVADEGSAAIFCQPPIQGWTAMRASLSLPPIDAAPVVVDRLLAGQPVRVISARNLIHTRTYVVIAAWPMGPGRDAIARLGWALAIAAPVVLAIAGVGGWRVSRRALAPVDRLTAEVQGLTLNRLDRRLDLPGSDDELRRLAVTFNSMLERIESGVSEMARFTANAAHELRTPVAVMRATAEVALSRDRPVEEYRQTLAELLKLAEQMSTLVADLLMLARADAGLEPRDDSVIDLGTLAREVCLGVSSLAAERGLTLRCDAQSGSFPIAGNDALLRRLLLILLDNAMQYTPPPGSIDVTVARTRDDVSARVVIAVADSGPGIDAADTARVFERFYRGAAARQLRPDGAGLGLSLAETLTRRHDGTITIANREGTRGCRVEVSFPAHAGVELYSRSTTTAVP